MPIAILCLAITAALLLQRLALKRGLFSGELRYRCVLSKDCCEVGEAVSVKSTVDNLSKLPAPCLRLDELMPPLTQSRDGALEADPQGRLHRKSLLAIAPHQRVVQSHQVSFPKRGCYVFGEARLYVDDLLGLKEQQGRKTAYTRLVVYPPVLEELYKNIGSSRQMEQISRLYRLLKDPISVMGYREYSYREPMKDISWKQSAIRGQLTVKEHDPVCAPGVCLVLDVDYKGDLDGYSQQLEYLLSLCRSLMEHFEDRDMPYKLVTNAYITKEIALYESRGGRKQGYWDMLYTLGIVNGGVICKVGELLPYAAKAEPERPLVYLAVGEDDSTREALLHFPQRQRLLPLYAMALMKEEA